MPPCQVTVTRAQWRPKIALGLCGELPAELNGRCFCHGSGFRHKRHLLESQV